METITEVGNKRLKAIVENDDGFKLSEIDLQIRGEGKGKHDHAYFEFDDGMKTAVYTDHRRFGFMDVFETSNEAEQKWLATLGPEPLNDDFTVQILKSNLHLTNYPK